jgi:hypothetical protein
MSDPGTAPIGPADGVAALLELGQTRPGHWQRLRGRRAAGSTPIRILAYLIQSAVAAEQRGAGGRADFYWDEVYRLLPGVWRSDAAWRAAVTDLGVGAAELSTAAVQQALVAHLVDLHRSWAAALQADDDGNPRVDRHLTYLLAAIAHSTTDADAQMPFADAVARRVRAQVDAGRLADARTLCDTLLARFPDESRHQRLRIEIDFKLAMRGEWASPEKRLAALDATIDRMTAWRSGFHDHADLYDALGVLYLTRAVARANAGDVADALADLVRAETAQPGLEQIREVRDQVVRLLASMQAQVAALEKRVAGNPNATLTAEGRRLQTQTRRGFDTANGWKQSDECRAMDEGRRRGESLTVWRDIGLPIRDWTPDGGSALAAALGVVLGRRPASAAQVRTHWRDAATRFGIDDAHAVRACAWLGQRLGIEAAPELPAPRAVPIDRPGAPAEGEPRVDWLTSGSARRVRWQLAAALLLALTAAGAEGRETHRRHVRERAWQQLQQAATPGDAVRAAERFFAAGQPSDEPPARAQTAWAVYSESIVRVLAGSAGTSGSTGDILARYAETARRIPHLTAAAE